MIDQEIIDEKKLIRDFFRNKENGFFIEVGANEPDLVLSQTFHLEEQLDWNGILIEPIDYLAERLRKVRPLAQVFQVACTSPNKIGSAKLQIPVANDADLTGHASLEMNLDHALMNETRSLAVKAVTLDSILKENGINQKIDFLSIDVEGTELDVLKGVNLVSNPPKLIIVEDRLVFLAKHLYLKRHGYKMFRRTSFNNWYSKDNPSKHCSLHTRINLFRKIYLSSWIKRIRETFRMKTFNTLTHL
jgi:FkbM family methyltransferase